MTMLPILLFGAAILCAALSALLRKARDLLCLSSAILAVCGALCALALGWTLEELRAPLLLLCAASLAARSFGRGDGV